MSLIDTNLLSEDLDTIIGELPLTVTIGGTDYTGSKSMLNNDQIYSDYGLSDEYLFTVYVNINSLSSIPENHTLITISGVEYRILRKEIDSADQLLRMHVGSKYGKVDSK